MNNVWFWKWRKWVSGSRTLGVGLVAVLLVGSLPAGAGTPDWLRAAARTSLPDYPEETEAVMLLNEQITTVSSRGEIKTRYRIAYKILRPEGSRYGLVRVYFDNETRLTYLNAWSLPAGEKAYEVKQKEAVETSPFSGFLFEDKRLKWLQIPATHPGNVVGYEYEQKRRPFILQDSWEVAQSIPVRRARYTLRLPKGWEFEAYWVHCPRQEPQPGGKDGWVWELTEIPAVETEPAMPDWRAVAARLVVSFFPARGQVPGESHASWQDVGRWYARLARPTRQGTPEIQQKVAELTAAQPTLLDKIEALAAFLQREVRYVAIEIGIGGYQPHSAQAVFANRYGDCKDKATLLATMLGELGVESHYVLVNLRRGVVAPEAPTVRSFNHVILAVRLPEEVEGSGFYAVQEHTELGRLLFFDPTDELTPFGYLPTSLQANHGLLVTEEGGELLELPLLSPNLNRLLRVGKFVLTVSGDLTGAVKEIRSGAPAVWRRSVLLTAPGGERVKVLEQALVRDLGGFLLQGAWVKNLEEYDENLVLDYRLTADKYARRVGNLLLVRPRVLGRKAWTLLEGQEERKYPVEFPGTSMESDIVEIRLPTGYQVDELPPPLDLVNDFAEYHSAAEVEGGLLRYRRNYIVKDVLVPTERLAELKEFFRQIATDERNQAVFKRTPH